MATEANQVSVGAASSAPGVTRPASEAAAAEGAGTLVVFVASALIWGASFLFMKVALEGLAPAQVAIGRILLGATALIVLMRVGKHAWPRDLPTLGHLTVAALTFFVVPFQLFAWAGERLPSGLSSIYNATTPLMTMVMVLLVVRGDRLSREQVTGLILGAVGVAIILRPWVMLRDTEALAGTGSAQLACLGATACYGFGYAYTRRFIAPRRISAVSLAATQVVIAAIIGLALLPFIGRGSIQLTPRVVMAMLALGVLGTGIAYVWNQRVIREWGATAASTVTYLTPIVAVTLGYLVLGERLAWYEPVGAAVVLVGIMVGQGRLRGWRRSGRG